jgi:hypothetical protein
MEWVFFGLFVCAMIYYAISTELRSCFYDYRMTDFGVYLRAAWAARTGGDMYAVTCDNGWHYCYPPTFALFLMPLADPPSGYSREWYMPYEVSVAIWIVLSYAFAFWVVHALARLVLPDAIPGSRRWWSARNGPLALCAAAIGYTIVHGQVNTFVAALLAAMFIAWAVGRKLAAGMWLGTAIAVKLTPAFLVLFPLLHRDRRMLVGIAAGVVLMLGVLPAGVFGVSGAIRENLKFVDQVVVPGATGHGDQTRAKELTETAATDSHSFQAVLHNNLYPERYARPANASPQTRIAHWIIVAVMTAITMWIGWISRKTGVADQLVFYGCLLLIMVLASPVSHVHHFAMVLPAVCALWLKGLADRPGHAWPSVWVVLPLVFWLATTGLSLVPTALFIELREFGLSTGATVLLWAAGLWTLARSRRQANAAGNPIAGRIYPAQEAAGDAAGTAIPA